MFDFRYVSLIFFKITVKMFLSFLIFSISAIEMAKNAKQSAHRKFYNLPDNGPPDSADPSKQEDLLQIIQYINNSIIGTPIKKVFSSKQVLKKSCTQSVLRIRDVYPGSRILVCYPFQVPDHGSKNLNKREGWKKN